MQKTRLAHIRLSNVGGKSFESIINCNIFIAKRLLWLKTMRRLIYFDEREMLLCEWACEFGMKRQTLARRLNSGWSIEKALKHPVRDAVNMDAAAARITGAEYYKSVPCSKCGCKVRNTKKGYCPVCKRAKAKEDYKNAKNS